MSPHYPSLKSGPISLLLLGLASSCLSAPPPASVGGNGTIVRAETAAEAQELDAMVAQLRPRILNLLPDSALAQPIEVWLQDELSLYRFAHNAAGDAEGLWVEAHNRILLDRDAEDVRRTLSHELVHASLGSSWSTLPGSLEEGLCDWVAAQVSDSGTARLRAGRLSSAALLCGGLGIELEIQDESSTGSRFGPAWTTRVLLRGHGAAQDTDPRSHLQVFKLQAGLSSTKLGGGEKRGLYGLAYFLVHRVIERHGIEGLHKLCLEAASRELLYIPSTWLLSAADLARDKEEWRAAVASCLGPDELVELMRMYPDFIVNALEAHLGGVRASEVDARLDGLQATIRLVDGTATIDAGRLDFVRASLKTRAMQRMRGAVSRR